MTKIGIILTVASLASGPVWGGGWHFSSSSQAKTWTVSKTAGAADFATIQAAIDAASPGDTVEVIDSSTYMENLVIRLSKGALTVRAMPDQKPIVRGTSSRVIQIVGAQNITLEGLAVTGGTGDALEATGAPSRGLKIRNCRFEALPDTGIILTNGDEAEISNCTFVNLGGPCIELGAGTSSVITSNVFLGGPLNGVFADGIEVIGASTDIIGNRFSDLGRIAIATFVQDPNSAARQSTVRMINNLITWSGESPSGTDGIQLVGSPNTNNDFTIVNNTIVNSTRFGIGLGIGLGDLQSRALLVNNIVTGSRGRAGGLPGDVVIYGGSEIDRAGTLARTTIRNCLIGGDAVFASVGRNGNITGDPKFVDPAADNYQLQRGSIAIDAGDNASISGYEEDLAGNPRVADGDGNGTATVDLGAFEFHSIGCLVEPSSASRTVGSMHTLTQTVTDISGPIASVPVSFNVMSGPNAGMAGSGITDSMGRASFSYTSNGALGTDTIEASGTAKGVRFTCSATVEWTAPLLPLQYGQTVVGSIDSPGNAIVYGFEATAGDVIRVRMSRATQSLNPKITIIDPQGHALGEVADFDDAILGVSAPEPGTYRIRAEDDNGRETGSYGLHLQRLNNPVGARLLTAGQNLSSSIDAVAEMNAFSIVANAGDKLRIRMSRATGSLNPMVELFDSSGASLAELTDFDDAILNTMTTASGTYYLLLGDDNGRDPGGYGVSLQRLDAPAGATALVFGQNSVSSITAAAKMDSYLIAVDAGDALRIRVSRSSGSLNPLVELFDPTGVRLLESSDFDDVIIDRPVDKAGTLLLLVSDDNGRELGGYGISLQRLNNPANAVMVSVGQSTNSSINDAAEMDAYRFDDTAGQMVTIRMLRTSGSLNPLVELFDSNGMGVGKSTNFNDASFTVALPATGRYTILASDDNGRELGGYQLSFN
ncbi:MAG: right-handed parallel beta-helix repeat-containing protein [Acidobacteria bacterium]|nr:right-handed parallel beta-helix repeat-containing protein [Acidobacteriota bacterium]